MRPIFTSLYALALTACAPLPDDPPPPSGGDSTQAPFTVQLEPDAPLDAAPPVLRVRLRAAAGHPLPDQARIALVEGDVGSAHLGQLAREDVSMALEERLVPTIRWLEDDALVLAPLEPLGQGQRYAIASGDPKGAVDLTVADHDPHPTLELVWPPAGRGAGAWPARWCGLQPLPPLSMDAPLAPDRGAATFLTGAAATGAASHCIRLADPSIAPDDALRIPPPTLRDAEGAVLARLAPEPLSADAEPSPLLSRPCGDEAPTTFGPGCAAIADDRAKVLPSATPLLWVFAGLERAIPTQGETPFLLDGLPPASTIVLDLSTVDLAGVERITPLTFTTAPPMAHVVINEVVANPVGEEPQQEWVELFNDGLAPASLGGWQLEDVGGQAVLPPWTLLPGGYALVVNESFDENSEWDPMPPPDVPLLRVAELGNHGLSNAGEPMRLRDAEGRIVSRFPAAPKPKAGHSVARTHPKALDEIAESFVRVAEPTPGGPFVELSSR